MNDLPREKLHEIIIQYGRSIYDDLKLCEALLRDFCGQYRKEISVLVTALKQGIVNELLRSSNLPQEVILTKLTKKLESDVGLAADAARWAVESWALVLGVTFSCQVNQVARLFPSLFPCFLIKQQPNFTFFLSLSCINPCFHPDGQVKK
ncbi:hypothetical protein F7734_32665 [Scytonema sp. UIC 10036]|uniref:hypothetical protein n=1 Tax=Scytonema sp. UIC 10036 TaxID=2304196 RepID=UPI0012DAD92E|nr:hypothetical protein [Scytonema sp. UIC 10036]MUG96840.1 hypothetical protein [Scytonema sp. UIC 10036]